MSDECGGTEPRAHFWQLWAGAAPWFAYQTQGLVALEEGEGVAEDGGGDEEAHDDEQGDEEAAVTPQAKQANGAKTET